MSRLSENDNGFSLVEAILVSVLVILIISIGLIVYKDMHKTTKSSTATISKSSTSISSISVDYKTQEDLATITNTIENYPNNLPNKLSQFGIKQSGLNYNLSKYQYKLLANNDSQGYDFEVCGTFEDDTFTVSSFSNYANNYDGSSTGSSTASGNNLTASDFAVHDKGNQCYLDGGNSPDGSNNFQVLLNNDEYKLVNAACPNNQNAPGWCDSSSYEVPGGGDTTEGSNTGSSTGSN